MNRGFFSFNIQGKLLIAFLFAVLMPALILAVASYRYATQLSLDNLEAYIEASGARRQEAIENDFRTALNEINIFLDSVSNRQAVLGLMTTVYLQNTPGGIAQVSEIENLFQDQLITSNLFNSIWLLTPGRGNQELGVNVYADVTAPDQSLPFSRLLQEESGSDIYRLGRDLIEEQTVNGELFIRDTQALLVTERDDGSQHVEVVNLLFDEIEGEDVLVGYLVLDLNLDAIILDNLAEQIGNLETYAYLILPRTNEYIAPADVIEGGLVDVTSIGAQRVLAQQPSNVDEYDVGVQGERRRVIGYYAPIIVEDERFSLVTEIETNIVNQQLFSYTTGISFPILLGALVLVFLSALLITQNITPPLEAITRAVRDVVRGNFATEIPSTRRNDEIGRLANAFVDMRTQIQTLTDDMERRLQVRTRDVRVTQNITRTVTAERDLNRLMTQVVGLIVENFPSIYHAQIFLLDRERQFAILRASTGDAGRELLTRGHKLAIGSVSVIGQVTEQGQLIIARDTAESDVHRRNEFLQATRAELAIPLRLGDTIIGALDVQSAQRDAFDDDQTNALQTLADQVTIAIENARLYEESARLLSNMEQSRRRETQSAWQQYLRSQRIGGLAMQTGTDTGYAFETLTQAVYKGNKPVVGDVTERNTVPFAVPIILRGEILGVVEYEVPETEFSYDKVLLAEELVNRLAIALDNARLFQDSQQTAERERIVNEIAAKLTATTDVQEILQTAIREVGQALRTPQVAINLQIDDQTVNGHTNPSDEPEPSEQPEV
jgi:GAF domain-containing protein/HAMP domain-containing protein